jgi:hypothetical protein
MRVDAAQIVHSTQVDKIPDVVITTKTVLAVVLSVVVHY